MVEEYGPNKGLQVFLDKAREHGTGSTLRQKVNSIYKKGGKVNA